MEQVSYIQRNRRANQHESFIERGQIRIERLPAR